MRSDRKPLSLLRQEDRYAMATHEPGHAVSAYATGGCVQDSGIVLRKGGGLTLVSFPVPRRWNQSQCEYDQGFIQRMHKASITCSLAGPVAESRATGKLAHADGDIQHIISEPWEVFPDEDPLYTHTDNENCGPLFEQLICVLTGPSSIDKAMAALDLGSIDLRVVRVLVRLAKHARSIINQNWPAVQEIADRLMKKNTLDREEIDRIVRRHGVIRPRAGMPGKP